jgi:hypothetical protein
MRPVDLNDIVEDLHYYINTKPKHDNGLCWWLKTRFGERTGVRAAGDYTLVAVYSVVSEYMELLPRYSGRSYVDRKEGPTRTRLSFAAGLLAHLQDKIAAGIRIHVS